MKKQSVKIVMFLLHFPAVALRWFRQYGFVKEMNRCAFEVKKH
jgi:hypothetical protein